MGKISEGRPSDGIERLSVFFRGYSFSPHRHDTYAIGITAVGVQTFSYRGAAHQSLPGQAFILHPDERHDGRAGDDRGFGYQIAYIDPALILEAGTAKLLPFVAQPVSNNSRLHRVIRDLLYQDDDNAEELATLCNLVSLSVVLSTIARELPSRSGALDLNAVRIIRDLLRNRASVRVMAAELEAASGMSRWQLARQFRAAYGISPYRYHLLCRLRLARELMRQKTPLADAALTCGFADQAHMSRHFRSAFGLPPGQWRALSAS
jgi:AraC-like DNA-binding protein